jgi:hypothetical protein
METIGKGGLEEIYNKEKQEGYQNNLWEISNLSHEIGFAAEFVGEFDPKDYDGERLAKIYSILDQYVGDSGQIQEFLDDQDFLDKLGRLNDTLGKNLIKEIREV